MKPLGLSAYRVAKASDVPPNRIQDIAREERNIAPATALRLAKLFGNSPEFWMNL
jgi:addiction module HigA family antidote